MEPLLNYTTRHPRHLTQLARRGTAAILTAICYKLVTCFVPLTYSLSHYWQYRFCV